MRRINAITPGDRFGRWTALDATQSRTYPSGATINFHECRCDCGKIQLVGSYKLRTGYSRSCGCLQAEVTRDRSFKHGHSKRAARTDAYAVWRNMISRCTNSNTKSYADYGARGIIICARWLESFENFLADMGEPAPGTTLDRVNNDGNYEPKKLRLAHPGTTSSQPSQQCIPHAWL